MSSKAAASGASANDAEVSTEPQPVDLAAAEREVAAADAAVDLIEAKMAGWQQTLDDAKAAAAGARARLNDERGN